MSTGGLIMIFFHVSDVFVHSVSEWSFALADILFAALVAGYKVDYVACFAIIYTFLCPPVFTGGHIVFALSVCWFVGLRTTLTKIIKNQLLQIAT